MCVMLVPHVTTVRRYAMIIAPSSSQADLPTARAMSQLVVGRTCPSLPPISSFLWAHTQPAKLRDPGGTTQVLEDLLSNWFQTGRSTFAEGA